MARPVHRPERRRLLRLFPLPAAALLLAGCTLGSGQRRDFFLLRDADAAHAAPPGARIERLHRRVIGEDLRTALSIILDRQIILFQQLAEFRVDVRAHLLHLFCRRALPILELPSTFKIVCHHLTDIDARFHKFFYLSRLRRKANA